MVNKAVRATGPVCRYGDEAKIAASIDGIAAAYKPYLAGIPAISAYARPCGRANRATDTPAIRSPADGLLNENLDEKAFITS